MLVVLNPALPTAPDPAPPPPQTLPLAPALEFDLTADQAARLLRCPPIASRRQGRARTEKRRIIWHDTPGGGLAKEGRAVAEQNNAWRLERLRPGSTLWLPATPAPVLARAATSTELPGLADQTLAPVAAFTGTSRTVTLLHRDQPARLELLEGNLRGVSQETPCHRLILSGDPAAMASLAMEIADHATLSVPEGSLAAQALAFARGTTPAARHLGAPHLPAGQSAEAALVMITGHLADVILHWAPLVPAGEGPEPVHQMRVAVRRLRSALSIFRRAAGGEAVKSLSRALKQLASLLGAARDWDVFLDGSGAEVARAFPAEKRVTALVAAAGRRRTEAYAGLTSYLGSAAWRLLALRLALLPSARPWLEEADPEQTTRLTLPAATYAAAALQRGWKRLRALGEDFDALPPDALHELRKDAKRLRYAAEFFAPLFPAKPTRRFLERLVDLQEALGAVNDSHVAAALMARLGGGDRGFATGVVQGYVAASSAGLAAGASRAWKKLGQQDCFWV